MVGYLQLGSLALCPSFIGAFPTLYNPSRVASFPSLASPKSRSTSRGFKVHIKAASLLDMLSLQVAITKDGSTWEGKWGLRWLECLPPGGGLVP